MTASLTPLPSVSPAPQSRALRGAGTVLRLQRLFIAAFFFSAYISFSFATPLGFISLADLVLAVFLGLFLTLNIALAAPLPKLPAPLVLLSLACFVSVLVSTKIVNHGLPLSPVIKYSIFLLLLPLTLWLSMSLGLRPDPGAVFSTITICGNVFLVWVLLSLALGQSGGSGDEFAIHILGQPVYKNQLGHYLVFVSIANFLSWCLRRQARFLLPFALAILTSLALDVRGPVAASLLVAFFACLRFFGLTPRSVLGIVAMMLFAVLLAFLVIHSGLFEAQLNRFSELSALGEAGDNVSSTQSRLLLWAFGWRLMLENPVFGVGHGGFFYDEGEGWLYGMYQPHNNLVQIGAEGGFSGLALFLILLWLGMRRRGVSREVTALRILATAYLVTTLVDIIWVRGTGHLFWALFYLQAFCAPGSPGKAAPTDVRSSAVGPAPGSGP